MTLLKLLAYWLTLPIKIPMLALMQVYGEYSNYQAYDPNSIPKRQGFTQPPKPPMINDQFPEAGYPDHTASRTGECIDINLLTRESLKLFIDKSGELTRGPHGFRNGPPVSGDMLCGWLLGFTSLHNSSEKPIVELRKVADWLLKHREAPTVRLDCGYRINPLLVGAQAVLPLAAYWTAYKYTSDKKYLKRYLQLGFMGYWYLCIVPTAFVHRYPFWLKRFCGVVGIKLPHNPRSLYNDANVMRCLCTLIRETKGMHRFYYKVCALIVWFGSRRWHLPFMDYVALGKVREKTKDYVAFYLAKETRKDGHTVAPVPDMKWGESWDDERYRSSLTYNVKTIGPYFEWFYATRS